MLEALQGVEVRSSRKVWEQSNGVRYVVLRGCDNGWMDNGETVAGEAGPTLDLRCWRSGEAQC